MGLTLREAAEAAGLSKSSIHRAIQSGRLSATRLEGGAFDIDPSELARAFPSGHPRDSLKGQHGTAETAGTTAETRVRLAVLEADIQTLKTILEAERRRSEELREERNEWRAQATRLALPRPESSEPPKAPASPVPSFSAPRRSLWPFRRSA